MNYLFKGHTTYRPKYVILRPHAPVRARARLADALLASPTGFKLLRSPSRSPSSRKLRRHHVASSGTPCLVGNTSTARPHRLASGGKACLQHADTHRQPHFPRVAVSHFITHGTLLSVISLAHLAPSFIVATCLTFVSPPSGEWTQRRYAR